MVWQELRSYAIDGLFVVGGVAVGGPTMVVLAAIFACGF